MTAVLLTDIHSVLKGRELYGKKSDVVKIIFESEEVLIVEGFKWVMEEVKKGKLVPMGVHRYPVSKKDIKIKV